MKITVYAVTTCIPEAGETEPQVPAVFATEAEAEAHLEEMLKEEWEAYPIYSMEDDETVEPYPGDWRTANDRLLEENGEGSWGQWQLTTHEIEIALEPDIAHAIQSAIGAISYMDQQISQMEGMFDDDDGQIAEARKDGDAASEALEQVLKREATPSITTQPEVFIQIDGGLVQSVYGLGLPIGTRYTTIDYDVEGADEDEISLVNGEEAYINGGKIEPWTGKIKHLDKSA